MVQSKSKLMLLTIAFIICSFLLSGIAFAGGWHKIGPKEGNAANTFDPDAGLWKSISGGDPAKIPHLGLQSSTNKCRTCHAVHNADNVNKELGYDSTDVGTDEDLGTGQSFKLLRNESRNTECYFCHGTMGALSDPVKKPYAPIMAGPTEIPPKGMHTLGAEEIPDSTVDDSFLSSAGGLTCGNCHSVHGGWTLNDVSDVPGASSGLLNTRILRRDPAQNGNDSDPGNDDSIGSGAAGGVINVQDQGVGKKAIKGTDFSAVDEKQTLAAFCGDCHNKNVNWDRGATTVVYLGQPACELDGNGNLLEDPLITGCGFEGERPNKFAHPLGKVDGMIDIYGKMKKVEPTAPTPRLSCDNCHASRVSPASRFPHQSIGHKLMDDGYTQASTPLASTNYLKPWDVDGNGDPLTDSYTGDPNRPLPALDANLCRGCHADIGQPGNVNSF